MIEEFIREQIKRNFQYNPTSDQLFALNSLADFMVSTDNESLLLIKGYAGTGKTSLIATLVRTMNQLEQKCILLAPTGRAAKVMSNYAHHPALTIHKKIYRQRAFANEASGFAPADNLHKDTLFIVDEASMISNDGLDSVSFGTGRLLDDLIQYV
ncbi:MAG: AAA family ATPase, partial [Tannerellaceae bacterium]